MKKMSDFEELFAHFNTKYSGTAFPPLPKKVLMMNETVARQRRNNLDRFLRFLACTPKLCTDQQLLVFLGRYLIITRRLPTMKFEGIHYRFRNYMMILFFTNFCDRLILLISMMAPL